MTREEWKDYKDFDEISRDMNGLFSEWPTPSEIVAGATGHLMAEDKADNDAGAAGHLKAEGKAESDAKVKPKISHLSPLPPPWEQSIQ
jgi:hypothetical protein